MTSYLAFALLIAVSTGCCDAKHDGYTIAAEGTKLCVAKGGIPITEPIIDEGQHTFNIMKQCAFPCDQRLTVEKP